MEGPVPAGIKWGHWRGPRSSSDTQLRTDQSRQRSSRDAGPEGDLVAPRWGGPFRPESFSGRSSEADIFLGVKTLPQVTLKSELLLIASIICHTLFWH